MSSTKPVTAAQLVLINRMQKYINAHFVGHSYDAAEKFIHRHYTTYCINRELRHETFKNI